MTKKETRLDACNFEKTVLCQDKLDIYFLELLRPKESGNYSWIFSHAGSMDGNAQLQYVLSTN